MSALLFVFKRHPCFENPTYVCPEIKSLARHLFLTFLLGMETHPGSETEYQKANKVQI